MPFIFLFQLIGQMLFGGSLVNTFMRDGFGVLRKQKMEEKDENKRKEKEGEI